MALVTALMALLLMLALGAGIAVTTMTEVAIAANHRDGIQALYAAETGIELALSRLRAADDWPTVLNERDAVTLIEGGLADLLQSGSVDARSSVIVTVSRNTEDDSELVMQSSAIVPGGIRRTVQVTVKRAASSDEIEIMAWR